MVAGSLPKSIWSFSRMRRLSFCLSQKRCCYPILTLAILCVLAMLLSCATISTRSWESYSKYLREAEAYERQGEFLEAIKAYRQHIQKRLENENRAEWENPAFYRLLIGDLYLKESQVEEALREYEEARSEGVAQSLVADRFRLVASWLAEQGQTQEAIEVLSRYRNEDPILFDLMRDRLAREKVAQEEKLLQCDTTPSDACAQHGVKQSEKSERLPNS